jgi:hypothetical protein
VHASSDRACGVAAPLFQRGVGRALEGNGANAPLSARRFSCFSAGVPRVRASGFAKSADFRPNSTMATV